MSSPLPRHLRAQRTLPAGARNENSDITGTSTRVGYANVTWRAHARAAGQAPVRTRDTRARQQAASTKTQPARRLRRTPSNAMSPLKAASSTRGRDAAVSEVDDGACAAPASDVTVGDGGRSRISIMRDAAPTARMLSEYTLESCIHGSVRHRTTWPTTSRQTAGRGARPQRDAHC